MNGIGDDPQELAVLSRVPAYWKQLHHRGGKDVFRLSARSVVVLVPIAAVGNRAVGNRAVLASSSMLVSFGTAVFLLLAVGGMFLWLWQYPIAARLNELGPDLLRMLEDLTETIGTTPEAYLSFVWKGTLVILGALFGLKVLLVAWRYRRWGRRAIIANSAPAPSR